MSSWKDNPAIVAIITGATVLTTTLFVVFTYVLPVLNQAQINEIKELKEKNKKSQQELNDKENKLTNLDAEYKYLKTNFQLLSYSNTFQFGSPFPMSYSKIIPGSSLEDFYKTYKKPEIITNKNSSYLTLNTKSGAIGSITYYIDSDSKKISHMLLIKRSPSYINEKNDDTLRNLSLFDLLDNTLGKSTSCEGTDYISWKIPQLNLVAYADSTQNSYTVFPKEYRPIYLPEKCVNEY